MEREISSLLRQRLVQEKQVEISLRKSTRMYTLTKAGHKVVENLRRAKRVVVAYHGLAQSGVQEHGWLRPFASFGGTVVFRNF